MRSAREEHVIDLDDNEIAALAPVVGIGAVKYADLMQNRTSDYQFDWDKLISFKGNAGPYLQYAHARIQAVFRKGEVDPSTLAPERLVLEHPAELALGTALLRFADVVHSAAEQCLPHLLCEHLYVVARAFSVFYEACPMLRAEPAQRDTRLTLAWLAARQLRRGLDLLGIAVPDRM
jgi:arginyl-tRNA synthetase